MSIAGWLLIIPLTSQCDIRVSRYTRYAPVIYGLDGQTPGWSMAKIPDFHSTGTEDVDELVYHNQSDCPVGDELHRRGTAAVGQGYFRTLCIKCKAIADGYEGNRPL
jgi:hypothetical protein